MPEPSGRTVVVPQPSPRDFGVIAFTGRNLVFADIDPAWIHGLLPPDDVSAPLSPPFLHALGNKTGREIGTVDLLALAPPLPGPPPIPLTEVTPTGHPRVARALRHRDDVRVWTCPEGVVLTGRGVAGRWEVAVEVDEAHRGHGVGRTLARAARHLVPGPLWAQIAPGNAASVRAFLAADFIPVGAEVLLTNP
ncbi:GNAT family N-acetyltransferase [Spongiactinospora sp. TRM90649]|uniref:GNAT family N-acetyltransferase n=1 Tax=Spongiactinospora sp. TRM90649 TaxID=3031114 RepID=UPI0023F6CEDD|nr:GNAT family N-acetyltransferase [Spongiactinospora sp. TRM90649]MDF5755755.1 GNAT family N-acetyltransferase [Spongiactinospora sp. TRM90649]